MLLEATQKKLTNEKLESLMVEKKAVKFILGTEHTLMMVGSHTRKQL